ncbi:MAG: DctP family TRAP transporter solute-binding subunit [Betaproteobacteria bacterium]
MRNLIRFLIAGLLAIGAQTVMAKVTFNLSTPDPDNSEITLAAQKYAELVKAKTNGEVEIKVFPNGQLYSGDPSAAVRQLSGGSLDMLLLSTSLYANFNSKFTAISIPYLYDNTEQLRGYLAGPLGKELLGDLDKIGIKGLIMWQRPFRQMTNSRRPISAPSDVTGMKFRVPNNPLWMEFFAKMGAVPTPMAFGEVYNALQLKVVDGQENPINIPVAAKFYEVQKYASMTNHMADGWVLAINPAKYAKLTDQQKKAVQEASVEAEAWKFANDSADANKSVEFLKSKGMEVNTLTPEQQKAFVAVSKQLYPKFLELVKDASFFDKTLTAVGKK